jgi:hypothetical protein
MEIGPDIIESRHNPTQTHEGWLQSKLKDLNANFPWKPGISESRNRMPVVIPGWLVQMTIADLANAAGNEVGKPIQNIINKVVEQGITKVLNPVETIREMAINVQRFVTDPTGTISNNATEFVNQFGGLLPSVPGQGIDYLQAGINLVTHPSLASLERLGQVLLPAVEAAKPILMTEARIIVDLAAMGLVLTLANMRQFIDMYQPETGIERVPMQPMPLEILQEMDKLSNREERGEQDER